MRLLCVNQLAEIIMEKYAVFEIIGENWEQMSVWLDEPTARAMLKASRSLHKDRAYYLLKRVDA